MGVSKRDALSAEVTARTDDFTRWDALFHRYSRTHAIPWRWLKAIAWIESDLGRDRSVQAGLRSPGSIAGISADGLSRGLMQVTMKTANEPYMRPGTSEADLDDPEISVQLAARYLAWLRRYHKDREGIIRSYNGGPGWKNPNAFKTREQFDRSFARTQTYYDRFQDRLERVLILQPGNEMEIG